jgi:hypothetical protein
LDLILGLLDLVLKHPSTKFGTLSRIPTITGAQAQRGLILFTSFLRGCVLHKKSQQAPPAAPARSQGNFPIALKLFAKTFLIGSINRVWRHLPRGGTGFWVWDPRALWFLVRVKQNLGYQRVGNWKWDNFCLTFFLKKCNGQIFEFSKKIEWPNSPVRPATPCRLLWALAPSFVGKLMAIGTFLLGLFGWFHDFPRQNNDVEWRGSRTKARKT